MILHRHLGGLNHLPGQGAPAPPAHSCANPQGSQAPSSHAQNLAPGILSGASSQFGVNRTHRGNRQGVNQLPHPHHRLHPQLTLNNFLALLAQQSAEQQGTTALAVYHGNALQLGYGEHIVGGLHEKCGGLGRG